MKFKKLLLSMAALLGLMTLAACSSSGAVNKNVVTMKGNTVEVIDIYNEAKIFPNLGTSQLIQNVTFSKMFEHEFGKEVTDKDVDKEYNKAASAYGDQFSSYLSQQGLSEDAYKEQIRIGLLRQAAVDKQTEEHHMSQADLKAAWKTYYPEVDAYIASATSEADAKKTHDEAKNKAADFKKSAAANKLEQKFDSSNQPIPDEVKTAAFKLKNNQVSDVIKVQDSSTGSTSYYVVYMINNPGKGSDMKKYESQLKNYIKTTKRNDQTYVSSVMKHYLTEYNVTVKEQAFSNVFSQYLGDSQQ